MVASSDEPVVHAEIPYNVVPSVETNEEDEGHCVWYNQCGPGFNPDTNLNCPATKETRNGPKLTDPKGLELLKKYCPDMYKGKNMS